MMNVHPRGPLSEAVWTLMTSGAAPPPVTVDVHDALVDDDLHLALYLAYELHYRGLDGIDEHMEWSPSLIALRGVLEQCFEVALRETFTPPSVHGPIDQQLRRLIAEGGGPSLSSFMARRASAEMYREFLMHRSAYHLKEADPHSFSIPRLRGRAKVAMMEIQSDEYGSGDAAWMHSTLFASSMRALGLDEREGTYVDRLPGVTLATVNLVSMFGLHRRLRAALVGHLAVFEMTSCIPNRRYGDGLRRLGYGEAATRYFDEHVEADAAHGTIAAHDLAGSLVDDEPELAPDVLFGASSLLGLERRWAEWTLGAWNRGACSLFEPVPDRASVAWA